MAADHRSFYELLHHHLDVTPALILRRGSTPQGELAIVCHSSSTITINRAARSPDFAAALIRATVCLHRGSARAPDPEREEATVREIAAGIAVRPVLPLLDDTEQDIERMAQILGVDTATVSLGIQLAAADRAGRITR